MFCFCNRLIHTCTTTNKHITNMCKNGIYDAAAGVPKSSQKRTSQRRQQPQQRPQQQKRKHEPAGRNPARGPGALGEQGPRGGTSFALRVDPLNSTLSSRGHPWASSGAPLEGNDLFEAKRRRGSLTFNLVNMLRFGLHDSSPNRSGCKHLSLIHWTGQAQSYVHDCHASK